ncbi:MAG: hypothetical protein ACI9MU_003232 [Alphaproteobacteria bacterium]|jgi:hypothetical protein
MRRRGVLDAQASGSARQRRPIAASRSLTGAAVQLPQTGRSCLAQRDRAGKVCYADGADGRSCSARAAFGALGPWRLVAK